MSIPDNFLFLENVNQTARALLHYKWNATTKGVLERFPNRGKRDVFVDPDMCKGWDVEGNRDPRFDHLFWSLMYFAYPHIAFYSRGTGCKSYIKYAIQHMIDNPVEVYKALDDYDDDELSVEVTSVASD